MGLCDQPPHCGSNYDDASLKRGFPNRFSHGLKPLQACAPGANGATLKARPPLMKSVPLRFDLAQIFGIDPRTLALFRVALALVLLSDLWLRARDIGAFYTDAGVLPRAAQIEIYSGLPALFSLHLLNGTPVAQWILFALAFVAALALLVGYRTRWATLVSWVLLISLHNRNPMVLQGGDFLLRMMLFWSLFLPLHARASLDRWLAAPTEINETEPYPNVPWVSTATLAALLQVGFVYWFSAAFKSDAAWRSEGSAIGYALSIDQLAKPLGRALLQYPDLLRALTLFTFRLEQFGPWLALLPFWRSRTLMVAVFCGFHLVMGLCLTLGIFTWIAPTAWLLFVPSGAWDWLAARLSQLTGKTREALDAARTRLHDARAQTIQLARKLGAQGSAQPHSLARGQRVLRQSACAFFLVYVFSWNLRTLDFPTYSRYFPPAWNGIGDSLRLDQMWNMFSPFPFKEDGWFVAPATLGDGKRVNLLFPDQELNFGRPLNLSAAFDPLWQKYLLNLWDASNTAHRAYLAAYLVRQWNDSHPPEQRVQSLELLYMQQTNLPGLRKDKIQKIVMWEQKF